MVMRDYGAICDPNGNKSGLELWNNARTMHYAGKGLAPPTATFKECECPSLETLLAEGQGYETPGLGAIAPWYDPNDCDSQDFGGILMLDIDGIDDATTDRQVIANLNEGAAFGPLRKRHKEVTFRALLIGKTGCGVNYGLNWLKRELTSMPDGCDLAELSMFECCPCIGENLDSAEKCVEKYERTFKKVALLSGPRVTRRIGNSCGCGCGGCSMMEVEWTFGFGLPYKFTAPRRIIEGATASGFEAGCVEWFKGTEEECGCGTSGCQGCGDTDCFTAEPPRAPALRMSCSCEQPVFYSEQCFRVYARDIPDTGESVLLVEVENNSESDLFNAQVVITPNATGTPCDELSECEACATLSIPCVPARARWKADGTTQTITVACDGDATPDRVHGASTCFPVLDPCSDYCICVQFAGSHVPPSVNISVSVITREH